MANCVYPNCKTMQHICAKTAAIPNSYWVYIAWLTRYHNILIKPFVVCLGVNLAVITMHMPNIATRPQIVYCMTGIMKYACTSRSFCKKWGQRNFSDTSEDNKFPLWIKQYCMQDCFLCRQSSKRQLMSIRDKLHERVFYYTTHYSIKLAGISDRYVAALASQSKCTIVV